MVSDTRSTQKSKNESDGHSSKRKVNTRKNSPVCRQGNADRTSTSKQMTPSPQSARKSKRLDKEMLPVTHPVDRKSERCGKYNTPSPLRRSDRGKKEISSCSSGSKQSSKEPSPSESKRKKEKPLIEVTLESEKAELEQEAVGMKRKKMDARRFRGLFKMQRIHEIVEDGGKELDRLDKSFEVGTDRSGGIGSEQMGVVGENENDIHVDSSLRASVVNEPCSKYRRTSSSVGNIDNPARLPTNCCTTGNMDASESESSSYSARSGVGSVGSDGGESSMHPEEAIASPSSKCENCNILGDCVRCSKNIRLAYGSPEQELCSCSPIVNEDGSCVTCKDRGDLGGAVSSNSQTDGRHIVCSLCNKDGELLCCMGKGCKRLYHVCCVDPSLTDAPLGVWHCPKCVKRKLLFGVHSVSDGVESIWDVREVEISNGVMQKQYLVKYHGLAPIHNHWVSEKQLLLENPRLVSNLSEKDQFVRWSAEWMVPHRLLRKRPIQDKIFIASSSVISVCEYEWLVKWCCLDYDHATWELENSSFLSSSLGQDLMKDYEVRRQKAKKDTNKLFMKPVVKLPVLPASRSHVNVNYMLKTVNKLWECLFKCRNVVIFDDQERAMTVIYFIQSMSEICHPFLIVTATSSLSQWEAEFAQLIPSLDVVVYSGSTDTRKGIRASEFYDEEGCVMVQILLSSIEAVSEDLEILRSIKWKAIVIDEHQHSGISNAHEQLKMLSTDMRILLVSGQIKDTTSEYLKILSLVEPPSEFDKLRGLKPETSDSLSKLKERLSRFIANGRASQVSKFIEYWVPVQISNYQLEQYCDTLLSNSNPLCSYSRSDPVGALRDILLTVRKCCCHPYLLDPSSVQERLVAEKRTADDFLDVGIKASGKLQFLDAMLTEIKTRGLRVLILFQLIIGSGKTSSGDILDDFLRQRFGPNTYERVEAGVAPLKKQAAVSRFNKKETEPFVMLLENRACSSMIKLSSVDTIIIYDSDWNPANDLRALQKISIDSTVQQIKVFRLYSSFTIEERALVLSKQNLNLDKLQNISRATSDALLSWGATYLFSKLDEYHADSKSNSAFNFSSEQSLLEEVSKEFRGILSDNYEDTNSSSVISEVELGVGNYITNIPVLGEAKVQMKDGEEPHVFWRNLFDGRNPKWKHLKAPSPRNRKRVHYWEGSPRKSELGKDDMVKKRKKMVNENLDPTLVQVESGPSTIKACNQSEHFRRDCQGLFGTDVSVGAEPDERIVSSDEQKSFHTILQREMIRLCQTLKLTEDVTQVVRKFLEYVIKNHDAYSNSPSIVQAFQISLYWVAASIKKQKVDKKETFMLAKQLLNYQCTEEQAHSVYSKMRSFKRMYLQSTDGFTDSDRDCLLTEEDINRAPSNVNGGEAHFASSKQKNVKLETGEKPANEEHGEGHILVQQNLGEIAASEIDYKIRKIQRKCDKRMKKLVQKHQQEIQEFQQIWEKKRQELEKDHKLELSFVRAIHYQDSVGLNKLKLLEDKFANKMEEHNLLNDAMLKELKAKQLAAIDEERLKTADWLAQAEAWSAELRTINRQQFVNSQSDDVADCPQPSTPINIIVSGNVLPMSGQHVGTENLNKSTQGRDVVPLSSSTNAPAEAIGCRAPVESIATTNSQNEMGEMSPAIVELLNQSNHSNGNGETVPANLLAPVEQVSDDIRSVGPSEELPVPNEMVGHGHPGEKSNAANKESNKAGKVASSDDLVSQRGGTGEAASVDLHSTGQQSLPLEQAIDLPDCSRQVHRDETTRSLGSSQLQDSDGPTLENHSTSQIEVASSEPMESVAPAPSNLEIAIADEIVTPVPPSHEYLVNESSGQHPFSLAGASLNCNQAPATETPDQGKSSSQAAEHGGEELFCPELISRSEDNLEIHPDHLDIGPSTVVPHAQSVGSSAALQNDVSMPQVAANTLEQSNQAIPQLEIDVVNLCRPINARATHQPTFRNSAASLLGDPLQKELERILRETEQLEKTREDKMSQLKLDCDKEIEELISQIRNKYAGKFQETEAEFRSKRDELDKNQNKVMLNKILAEAVRSKCMELKPSGIQGVQQGGPSNLARQGSLPPRIRHPLGPLGSQAAHIQPITSPPAMQTPQQLSRLHPPRSSPVAIQSVAPPTITAQPVQQAAPHVLGPSPRPPVINAISPAGNPRGAGNEIRSIAPHLQPSRPGATSSTPPTTSMLAAQLRPFQFRSSQSVPLPRAPQQPSHNLVPNATSSPPTTLPSTPQLRPVQLRPQPVQVPPQPSGLPQALQKASPGLVTQDRAGVQSGVPAQPDPSPTTQMPSAPERRIPSLPDISTTFSSLELGDLEMLGSSVQGNETYDVASPVVCLSDDE